MLSQTDGKQDREKRTGPALVLRGSRGATRAVVALRAGVPETTNHKTNLGRRKREQPSILDAFRERVNERAVGAHEPESKTARKG